ncbi:hypothetical protein DSM104299_04195 [Baekduia alba]|uniref:hypothetical protein n=1 Tax=Baekduia alba TaxID=2997333 RepID=UPI0023401592|nr:hypothetical protein [Baekduia alba]WCB95450.1 hypothetical protein DSM104299_04195 [Baekduia alba]
MLGAPAARLRASGRSARAAAACAAFAVVSALAAAPAGAHAAPRVERLCSPHVQLRDHPRGVVIGHLYAPQRVTVTWTDATTHWWRIRTRADVIGWIPPQTGC